MDWIFVWRSDTASDPCLAGKSHRLDDAVQLLLEVVRLAPNAPDPYHTLGNIFQVRGDNRKALDFYMIAAHLPPKVPPSRGCEIVRFQGMTVAAVRV